MHAGRHSGPAYLCVITGNLIVFNPKSLILCVVYGHSIEGSEKLFYNIEDHYIL